ncbi:MAG: histidinol-phosphate transaminase [Bacteroidaceae bacterium]|nr:histidinol-phosphate transaminase [Bacteroidaceae bacterium]
MRTIEELTRRCINSLKPYSSARNEYSGKNATVFLDANENPYNNPLNRYPDPLQYDIKEIIAKNKGIAADQIFLGNGSDEAIDLMYRIFCNPGKDNVIAMEPSYGMYRVSADTNDIEYRAIPTDDSFQPDIDRMLASADNNTKLMFFCSPNNPSGNLIERGRLIRALDNFDGITIVDEAYIDFASEKSLIGILDRYPHLVILQTFSKAWGMAGIRLGMAFASPEIIALMNKVKYPYNINHLTQQAALEQLGRSERIAEWVREIITERGIMAEKLGVLPICLHVYPSDANFILVRVTDAEDIYNYLTDMGIIVRNRSRIALCSNSLRITIGTPEENRTLMTALNDYCKK